jgi:hypothetical protein
LVPAEPDVEMQSKVIDLHEDRVPVGIILATGLELDCKLNLRIGMSTAAQPDPCRIFLPLSVLSPVIKDLLSELWLFPTPGSFIQKKCMLD